MSKKIISAILVMAMVISMSATALLSSVGAAAETETKYQEDVDTLKGMIKDFIIEGPELSRDTYEYLYALKLVSGKNNDMKHDDTVCDGDCDKYTDLHTRYEFWYDWTEKKEIGYINDFFFRGTGDDFAKNFVTADANKNAFKKLFENTDLVWDSTRDLKEGKTTAASAADYAESWEEMAIANITTIVEYAASVAYFGQNADDANHDASFNEGRNAVVKKAISMMEQLIKSLKAEIGAKDDEKPVAYENIFNDTDDYRGFATASKAYNQSIGFNPYFYIIEEGDYTSDTLYGSVLGQYTVRWYTFAEAREIDAEGTFKFENAIRTMAIDNCASVLFYDFIAEKVNPFAEIVEDLFLNLVGDIEEAFVDQDIDAQIEAYLKLKVIIDIYDLYIKDVYNNIYTASGAELLNDVLYAKRLINFMSEDVNASLIVIAFTDFNALINDILAGIKAIAPRTEQLLKAADITEGTALVRKAEALLANWARNSSNEGKWDDLSKKATALKDMLPAAEGEDVTVIVPAEAKFYGNEYKHKNLAGTELKNDRVIVEFTPNWFSYIKLAAELKASIDNFTAWITGDEATLKVDDFNKNDDAALVAAINKYTYLVGIVGDIVEYADRTCDGKDNKIVRFIDTTEQKVCGLTDHGAHYVEDTGKATLNFRATVKYMSYLFDDNAVDFTKVGGPARGANALPAYAFTSSSDGIGAANTNSDIYSSTYCYVKDHYNDNYIQLLNGEYGVVNYGYLSNSGKVDSIYENVIGYVDGNNNTTVNGEYVISQDVAIDSVYVLMMTLVDAARYAQNNSLDSFHDDSTDANGASRNPMWDWSVDYDFDSEGKFDWVNDKYVYTSGHTKAINAITEAVKNLTKDLTTEIQTYYAILANVINLFGWDTIEYTDNAELNKLTFGAQSRFCWQDKNNYAKDAMKAALEAANELYSLLNDEANDWDEDEGEVSTYTYATYSKLIAAYNAFEDAIKTYLLTEAGAAKFDEYVEDVYYFVEAEQFGLKNVRRCVEKYHGDMTVSQDGNLFSVSLRLNTNV